MNVHDLQSAIMGGGKPTIIIARDGEDPEELEFTAMGLEICPSGHVHTILVGDPDAMRDVAADVIGKQLYHPEQTGLRSLEELVGLDPDGNVDLLKGNSRDGLDDESLDHLDSLLNDHELEDDVRAALEEIRNVDNLIKTGELLSAEAGGRMMQAIQNLMDVAGGSASLAAQPIELLDAEELAAAYQEAYDRGDAVRVLDGLSTDDVLRLIQRIDDKLPEVFSEHTEDTIRIVRDIQAGIASKDELIKHLLRLFVDPRYLTAMREHQPSLAIGPEYESLLEAYLDGNPTAAGFAGCVYIDQRPDLVEELLDGLEAADDD